MTSNFSCFVRKFISCIQNIFQAAHYVAHENVAFLREPELDIQLKSPSFINTKFYTIDYANQICARIDFNRPFGGAFTQALNNNVRVTFSHLCS